MRFNAISSALRPTAHHGQAMSETKSIFIGLFLDGMDIGSVVEITFTAERNHAWSDSYVLAGMAQVYSAHATLQPKMHRKAHQCLRYNLEK